MASGHEPRARAGEAAPPAGYTPYGERKPVIVAGSLSRLTGPVHGTVTLPGHLDRSGNPVHDLATWLNGRYLPPKVRRLWPDRFPRLASRLR